ncbi:MAG: CBS domain-containing protein, partial [Jaaginema sp. PMC 1079.18]|nr:CBS domain-containing protein [Jaaginema sp. PMC 1079.18]
MSDSSLLDCHPFLLDNLACSPPIAASDTPIVEAIAQMNQNQTNYVFVIDEGQFQGIFCDRDVLRLLACQIPLHTPLRPTLPAQAIALPLQSQLDLNVLLSRFQQENCENLPLVDATGAVVGLISRSHLLSLIPIHTLTTPKVLAATPLIVSPETPVLTVVRQMQAYHQNYAIAVRGDRPLGIITPSDILALLPDYSPEHLNTLPLSHILPEPP